MTPAVNDNNITVAAAVNDAVFTFSLISTVVVEVDVVVAIAANPDLDASSSVFICFYY